MPRISRDAVTAQRSYQRLAEWLIIHGVDPPGTLRGELCGPSHIVMETTRLSRGLGRGNRFFDRDLEDGSLELKIPGVANQAFGGYALPQGTIADRHPDIAATLGFLGDRMEVMEAIE